MAVTAIVRETEGCAVIAVEHRGLRVRILDTVRDVPAARADVVAALAAACELEGSDAFDDAVSDAWGLLTGAAGKPLTVPL